jgi:nicotinamide-nucleotide adenylyltransferase
MVRRGLYVGRFQPFHLGHLNAVKTILNDIDEIVIVIGSAQYSHTLANPFTAGERLTMIRLALEEAGLDSKRMWVVPVPDMHLHMLWVSSVEGYTPKFEVAYSNEPLTRRLFLEAEYKVKAIRFFERKVYSSTDIRAKMMNGESWKRLVPKSIAAYIADIDGVSRLIDLTKSDKV